MYLFFYTVNFIKFTSLLFLNSIMHTLIFPFPVFLFQFFSKQFFLHTVFLHTVLSFRRNPTKCFSEYELTNFCDSTKPQSTTKCTQKNRLYSNSLSLETVISSSSFVVNFENEKRTEVLSASLSFKISAKT